MPCPRCEAPLLGDPSACPECGQPLKAVAQQSRGVRRTNGPASARPAPAPNRPPTATQAPAQAQALTDPRHAAASSLVEPTHQPIKEVPVAPVEGLIDSRLFGAYVPKNLETQTMEGLETTAFESGQDIATEAVPGLVVTEFRAQPDTGAPAESVPGLIDARLFGAYVPEGIDAAPMEGFEATALEAVQARPSDSSEREQAAANSYHCAACGHVGREPLCPDCGQPARPQSLD